MICKLVEAFPELAVTYIAESGTTPSERASKWAFRTEGEKDEGAEETDGEALREVDKARAASHREGAGPVEGCCETAWQNIRRTLSNVTNKVERRGLSAERSAWIPDRGATTVAATAGRGSRGLLHRAYGSAHCRRGSRELKRGIDKITNQGRVQARREKESCAAVSRPSRLPTLARSCACRHRLSLLGHGRLCRGDQHGLEKEGRLQAEVAQGAEGRAQALRARVAHRVRAPAYG